VTRWAWVVVAVAVILLAVILLGPVRNWQLGP